MSESNDWGSSIVKPAFTNGGNNLQIPKTTSSFLNNYKFDRTTLVSLVPSSTSSSSRCQGWSAHGIKRFNELYGLVEKERMSSFGSQFEEDYLWHCIKAMQQGKKKENRNMAKYEVCRHELWTTSTSDGCNYIEDDKMEPDTSLYKGLLSYNRNDEITQDDNASVGFEGFSFDNAV